MNSKIIKKCIEDVHNINTGNEYKDIIVRFNIINECIDKLIEHETIEEQEEFYNDASKSFFDNFMSIITKGNF